MIYNYEHLLKIKEKNKYRKTITGKNTQKEATEGVVLTTLIITKVLKSRKLSKLSNSLHDASFKII